jgi:hypothetical protein
MRWLLLILMAWPLCAQDAAAVLARYVQVTGGTELYKRYNSLHLFYTVTHADKSAENVDYFHTRDGSTLIETDTGTATLDTGINEGIAWKYSQAKGAQILTGAQAARLLAEQKGFDEDDWKLRYPTAVRLGDHLLLTRTDGSTLERFYDAKSGLLVRQISKEFNEAGVEQLVTTDYLRYDDFFGLRRPVSMHVKAGSDEMSVEVNTVTYSDKPESGAAELPHDVARAILAARATKGGLPNPLELIDKYIAATGGRDRYLAVKSEVVTAQVSLADQNLKFSTVSYGAGNKHYSVSQIPSIGKLETGDDGVIGWEKSVAEGAKLRPHSDAPEFTAPEPVEVLAWSDGAMLMETVSQDQVNGTPCYLVRLGPKVEYQSTACFDVKTGLLLRTAAGTSQRLYSDYRSVSGLLVSYRIDSTEAGHTAKVEVQDVQVNQALPAGIFDLPPDVKALKAKRMAR